MLGGIADMATIPTFAVALIVVFVVARFFAWPILKLIYNALLGGIVLFVVNYFGGFFGFVVPLNIFTVLVAGIFGLPGVGLMILYILLTR